MKKIGIIGAMDVEIELLLNEMKSSADVVRTELFSLVFYEGKLNGVSVVVVKSGIGKVNAALCAQLLILKFDVTHVINTGIAGAVAKDLGILDMVVSTEAVYHDFDVTGFGYEPAVIPQMKVSVFRSDELMVKTALECFKSDGHKIVPGRIASGDQFISDNEKKEYIKKICNPACVEMEGAAIAHACYLCNVPFVILRCMSDMAEDGEETSYKFNEASAAGISAALVKELIVKI